MQIDDDNAKVEIRPSLLRGNNNTNNVGNGLFARIDFKKGDIICCYDGILIETDIAQHPSHISDYIWKYNKTWSIDASNPSSCYGRYVNDAIKVSKINAKIKNVKQVIQAQLVATKKIKAGEEIYVSYGESYWKDHLHYESLNLSNQQYLYRNGTKKFRDWVTTSYGS